MSTHVNNSTKKLSSKPAHTNETMLTKRVPKFTKTHRVETLPQDLLDEYQLENLSTPVDLKTDPDAPVVMKPILSFDIETSELMTLSPVSDGSGAAVLMVDTEVFYQIGAKQHFIEKEALLFTEMMFNCSKNNKIFDNAKHRGGARGILFNYTNFGDENCTPDELEFWTDYIFKLVPQPLSFVILAYMDKSHFPQIFKNSEKSGWYLLVVFQRELSSDAISRLIRAHPDIVKALPKKWQDVPDIGEEEKKKLPELPKNYSSIKTSITTTV